jgi:hypothetical protein
VICNYNSNSKDRALCVVGGSTVLACFLFLEYSMGSVFCCALVLPFVLPLRHSRPCFPSLGPPHFFITALFNFSFLTILLPLLIVPCPASFDTDAITNTSLQRNADIIFADTIANIVNLSVYYRHSASLYEVVSMKISALKEGRHSIMHI